MTTSDMRSQLSDFIRELTNTPDNDSRDPLLKPMECCRLFCEEIGCSRGYYYKHYYPYLRFDPIIPPSQKANKVDKRNLRIPFSIALGLVNLLSKRHKPETDPPVNELYTYLRELPPELK